jgi:hypothetical protein
MVHTSVAVGECLPIGASVLVVSKGDDALIDLPGVHGRHFPSTADGAWTGYHPSDAHQAIEWLETARGRGATHFLVPAPSFWWLDHYDGLRRHLDDRYDCVLADDNLVIYSLRQTSDEASGRAAS